jgi:hypothetical protein
MPWQGGDRRGTSLSRIELVDFDQETTVSGPSAGNHVFVQERVSAVVVLSYKAVFVIAKPGAKMLMPEVRADR